MPLSTGHFKYHKAVNLFGVNTLTFLEALCIYTWDHFSKSDIRTNIDFTCACTGTLITGMLNTKSMSLVIKCLGIPELPKRPTLTWQFIRYTSVKLGQVFILLCYCIYIKVDRLNSV